MRLKRSDITQNSKSIFSLSPSSGRDRDEWFISLWPQFISSGKGRAEPSSQRVEHTEGKLLPES